MRARPLFVMPALTLENYDGSTPFVPTSICIQSLRSRASRACPPSHHVASQWNDHFHHLWCVRCANAVFRSFRCCAVLSLHGMFTLAFAI